MMIEINGRQYQKPGKPVVVVCYDGCDPSYLADAFIRGISPTLASMAQNGFYASGLSAMPSFTNPNNVSIVCGAPPAVHGISGNYWFDRDTGREVMMTDQGPLRAPTILAEMARNGVRVAAVTSCTIEEHGISAAEAMIGTKVPDQYSPELSLFVLDAGLKLLQAGKADLLYLSLSDFVQHAYAPGAPESDDFIRAVDDRVARLIAAGATVGIVADHGMTDLSLADGTPNILYLGELLDQRFGIGRIKVICPITDPFVRHHGSLGGFVRIHVLDDLDHAEVRDWVRSLPGVHKALLRDEACRLLDLPYEREGDVTVLAAKGVALGTRRGEHKLDQLAGARLRSHGSLSERDIPFILSRPLDPDYRANQATGTIYNYDIFHFALNGTEAL
jgi:phosphonoacetate hydrolase